MAFALLVALSGPVQNFIRNIAILGHGLTCEGSLLFYALDKMHRIMAEPSYPVQESFQGTLSTINQIINKLDKILVHMEFPLADIRKTFVSDYDDNEDSSPQKPPTQLAQIGWPCSWIILITK